MATVHARCGCGYLHPVRLHSVSSMSAGSPQRAVTASPAPRPIDEDKLYSLEVVSELSEKLARKEEELEAAYAMAAQFEKLADSHRMQNEGTLTQHLADMSEIKDCLAARTAALDAQQVDIAQLRLENESLKQRVSDDAVSRVELDDVRRGRDIAERALSALKEEAEAARQRHEDARASLEAALLDFKAVLESTKAELRDEKTKKDAAEERAGATAKQLSEALLQLQLLSGEMQQQTTQHAEELAKITSECHARVADLQQHLQRMQAEGNDAAAAHSAHVQVAQKEHAGALQRLRDEHTCTVAAMEAQAAELAKEHAHERKELQRNQAHERTEMQRTHAQEVTRLQDTAALAAKRHANEVARMDVECNARVDAVREDAARQAAEHAAEMSEMQQLHAQEAERVKAAATAAATRHAEEIDRAHEDAAMKIEAIQNQAAEAAAAHAKEMREMQQLIDREAARMHEGAAVVASGHVEEITRVRDDAEARVAAVQDKAAQDAAEIVAAHTKDINDVREKHASEVHRLQEEAEAAVAAHAKEMREMQQLIDREAAHMQESAAAVASRHVEEIARVRDDAEARVAAVQDKAAQDAAEIVAAHTKDINDVREKHASEVHRLQEEAEAAAAAHVKEVQDMQQLLEREAARMHDAAATAAAAHKDETAALQRRAADAASAHAREMRELKQVLQAEVAAVRAGAAEDAAEVAAAHAKEVSDMREHHAADLRRVQAESAASVSVVEQRCVGEAARVREEAVVASQVRVREVQDLQQRHADEMARVQAAHAREISDLQALRAREAARVTEEATAAAAAHANELSEMQQQHAHEAERIEHLMATKTAAHDAAVHALEQQQAERAANSLRKDADHAAAVAALNDRIATLTAAHHERVEAMTKDFTERSERASQQFHDRLDTNRTESEERLARALREAQAELRNAAARHEAQLADVHSRLAAMAEKHAADTAQQQTTLQDAHKDELAKAVRAWEERYETKTTALDGEVQQLVKDVAGRDRVIAAKDAQIGQLNDVLATTVQEVEELRARTAGQERAHGELVVANEALVRDVEALQESARAAAVRQRELDEVLQLVEPVQEEFQRRMKELTDATHEAHDTLLTKDNEILVLKDKLALLSRHAKRRSTSPPVTAVATPPQLPASDTTTAIVVANGSAPATTGVDAAAAAVSDYYERAYRDLLAQMQAFRRDVLHEVGSFAVGPGAVAALSDGGVVAAVARCKEAHDVAKAAAAQAVDDLRRVEREVCAAAVVHRDLDATPASADTASSRCVIDAVNGLAASSKVADSPSPRFSPRRTDDARGTARGQPTHAVHKHVADMCAMLNSASARIAVLEASNSALATASRQTAYGLRSMAEDLSRRGVQIKSASGGAHPSPPRDGTPVSLMSQLSPPSPVAEAAPGSPPLSPRRSGDALLEGFERARTAADVLKQYIDRLEAHMGALESEASSLRATQSASSGELKALKETMGAAESSRRFVQSLLDDKEEGLKKAHERVAVLERQLRAAADEDRQRSAYIDSLREQLAATDPSNPDAQTMGSLMDAQMPLTPTQSPLQGAASPATSQRARSVGGGNPAGHPAPTPTPGSVVWDQGNNTTLEEGRADDPAAMSLILAQLDRAEQELKALRAGREADERRLSSEIRTLEEESAALRGELVQKAAEVERLTAHSATWAHERQDLHTKLQQERSERHEERTRATAELCDLADRIDVLQKEKDPTRTPRAHHSVGTPLDLSTHQPAQRGQDITVLQTPVLLDDVLNHPVMTPEMTRWRDRLLEAEAEYNTARRARDTLEIQMHVGGRLGPEHPAAAALTRAEEFLDLLTTIIRKQTALDEAGSELAELRRESDARFDSLRRAEHTVQEMGQRLSDAREEIEALKDHRSELETRVAELEVDCDRLLQQQRAAKTSATSATQEAFAEDKTRHAAHMAQVAKLKADLTKERDTLEEVTAEGRRLRDRVGDLEHALEASEDEKEHLRRRVGALQGEVRALKVSSTGSAGSNSHDAAAAAAREREVEALQRRNKQLEGDYGALLQELSAIQTEVGELHTTVGGAEEEVELVALVEECDLRRPKSAAQKPTPILERLQRHLESLFREISQQQITITPSERATALQADLAREVSRRRAAEAAVKRLEKVNRVQKQRFTREETLRRQLKDATIRLEELRLDNMDLRKIVHTQEQDVQEKDFKLKLRDNVNTRAKRAIKDLEGRVRATERAERERTRALTPEPRGAPGRGGSNPRPVSPYLSPRMIVNTSPPRSNPMVHRTVDSTEAWTED